VCSVSAYCLCVVTYHENLVPSMSKFEVPALTGYFVAWVRSFE